MALLSSSRSTSISSSLPPLSPSSLLLATLRPLYPTLEVAHRLILNSLALSLLILTLPFSLYLTYGQTSSIARGEGRCGRWVKEMSGCIWEGFDWLEECENEGVMRGWMERVLGGEDNLEADLTKRRRYEASHGDASGSSDSFGPRAAARRDSGIEILD